MELSIFQKGLYKGSKVLINKIPLKFIYSSLVAIREVTNLLIISYIAYKSVKRAMQLLKYKYKGLRIVTRVYM